MNIITAIIKVKHFKKEYNKVFKINEYKKTDNSDFLRETIDCLLLLIVNELTSLLIETRLNN